MNALILMLAPLIPLLLACFAYRLQSRWWLFAAPLPALYLGLMGEQGSTITLPWLMLGMHLSLDATAQQFLLFGAMIWMLASLYIPGRDLMPGAMGHRKQSFLLAMAGNLLLIIAADMLTFYVGFALMGLSAYGLIWGPSQRARKAARVYLVFTLIGELALFSALLLLLVNSQSLLFAELHSESLPQAAVALLLLGFGIKVALPGLHLWLPGAYTLAPIFGVALLSGPMMKAGLLGWLRFLPLGEPLDPLWGNMLLLLGVAGVVLGMSVGMFQRDPRSVLAYSSISKMGLFSALIGFTLNHPGMAAELLPVIVLLALHHLMVKPMLFMGLDLWRKGAAAYWLMPALTLLSLSLMAFPLTGGGAVKNLMSDALNENLAWLLFLGGIAAALLMSRFLWLLWNSKQSAEYHRFTLSAWLMVLPLAVWAPFAWDGMSVKASALLPLLSAAVLLLIGQLLRRRFDSLQQPLLFVGNSMSWRIPLLAGESVKAESDWQLVKRFRQRYLQGFARWQLMGLRDTAVWWLMLMLLLALALRN
ncbi:MAG: complex I subunit 5 family protein [Candidatus Thiodiazotropha taylori]|nr:complex I subunit 5 family protein [Candidatus Thiodiazotropha taylori]MCG8106110.1 complex I subunit 5 family protein [Candidatus Thiodiazotropha taylori]MCG8109706.1 complex I subunit 5 family protein [Candidatus Thiodiazotropha taylori]MCW4278446.1 complex I subunit 5 family protein [Candidatus Thiodiazotropha taylori]MCW4282050.1 complex I subunit 5 family protein [Candidatus Thiodiazotropha taylori]